MESLYYIIETMTTKERTQSQAGVNHLLTTILHKNSRARTVRAGENQKIELDIDKENENETDVSRTSRVF